MAVQNSTAVSKSNGAKPLVVVLDDFKGTPMFKVLREGSDYPIVNHSVNKWAVLFENDKDGDSILGSLFDIAMGQADAEGKKRLLASAKKFAEKIAAIK